ncbi:unnamed protein product [Psylliodes chrysocephalus]|uniref:Uncharacterized protein n=1 Tax=Psylliodes chrysocephalus TaxID=3402493 RepID=A0A9P0GB85_9CUCU|nr:unnamed protein product [Psylliodes chrysocephala]
MAPGGTGTVPKIITKKDRDVSSTREKYKLKLEKAEEKYNKAIEAQNALQEANDRLMLRIAGLEGTNAKLNEKMDSLLQKIDKMMADQQKAALQTEVKGTEVKEIVTEEMVETHVQGAADDNHMSADEYELPATDEDEEEGFEKPKPTKNAIRRERRKRNRPESDGERHDGAHGIKSKKPTPETSPPSATAGAENNTENDMTVQEAPKVKIPPIVLKDTTQWNSLHRGMKSRNINFQDPRLQNGGLRIFTNTSDDYHKTVKYFEEMKVKFYCYTLQEDKPYKAVLRGVPTHNTPEDVTNELILQGITPLKVQHMRSRYNKSLSAFKFPPSMKITFNQTTKPCKKNTIEAHEGGIWIDPLPRILSGWVRRLRHVRTLVLGTSSIPVGSKLYFLNRAFRVGLSKLSFNSKTLNHGLPTGCYETSEHVRLFAEDASIVFHELDRFIKVERERADLSNNLANLRFFYYRKGNQNVDSADKFEKPEKKIPLLKSVKVKPYKLERTQKRKLGAAIDDGLFKSKPTRPSMIAPKRKCLSVARTSCPTTSPEPAKPVSSRPMTNRGKLRLLKTTKSKKSKRAPKFKWSPQAKSWLLDPGLQNSP